jgi:outer membrane autotransporter protein
MLAGGVPRGADGMPLYGGEMYMSSRPGRKTETPISLVSTDAEGNPIFDVMSGPEGTPWTPWGQGFGSGGEADTDGNAEGIDYSMGGIVAGAERWLDYQWLLGLYGGYVGTNVGPGLDQKINGGQIGGYLYSDDGCNYCTLLGGFQFDGYTTQRQLLFGDIDRIADASASGWQGFAYGERGVAFRHCNQVFQPFIGLQYIHVQRNHFTETGAGEISLDVDQLNGDSLRLMPGARAQWAAVRIARPVGARIPGCRHGVQRQLRWGGQLGIHRPRPRHGSRLGDARR